MCGLSKVFFEQEDRPALVLYTSGSSGTPKGVSRSFREVHLMQRSYGVPNNGIHLSIQPLSHLSEVRAISKPILATFRSCPCTQFWWRNVAQGAIVPTLIIRGGRIGFSSTVGMHRDVVGDMRGMQRHKQLDFWSISDRLILCR